MVVNRNPNLIPRKSYFTVSPSIIREMLVSNGLDQQMVEPLTQTLGKLFNKFGADERLNYDVIERAMNRSGGITACGKMYLHAHMNGVVNNTTTKILLDYDSVDIGYYDTEPIDTNINLDKTNHEMVVEVAGTYVIHGQVAWAANATGGRLCQLRVDRPSAGFSIAEALTNVQAHPTQSTYVQATMLFNCAVDDKIQLEGAQTSGAGLQATGGGLSWLGAYRLGEFGG